MPHDIYYNLCKAFVFSCITPNSLNKYQIKDEVQHFKSEIKKGRNHITFGRQKKIMSHHVAVQI